jgi:uncharacterized membrane protein YozB (DUF420 family)
MPRAVQTNSAPTAKVTAGIVAGAISTIVVTIVNNYIITGTQPKVDATMATAITTVLTFLVQYFWNPDQRDQVKQEGSTETNHYN